MDYQYLKLQSHITIWIVGLLESLLFDCRPINGFEHLIGMDYNKSMLLQWVLKIKHYLFCNKDNKMMWASFIEWMSSIQDISGIKCVGSVLWFSLSIGTV